MKEGGIRVLIVDDEPEIRRFLRASLKVHQYEVFEADTGAKALVAIVERRPELLILDLGLPDMDGLEVTRQVRKWSRMPIIVLSVRNREDDKILALDAGADDYLTKPFGVGELMARIRVVMRRSVYADQEPVQTIGEITVDLARRRVMVGEKEVALTRTEFDLLRVLIQNAGKVVTHHQLIHQVWGMPFEDESRLLRVNISNLRRKVEPDSDQPHYILTELGVGYRFREE